MALIPNDPFKQLANMRSLFSNFSSLLSDEKFFASLRVDVHETNDQIIVTCDLPGLESKEDIHIDISEQTLNISGTIKQTKNVDDKNVHHQERFMGRFQRTVTLPAPVSRDGAKASYHNGVLEVSLPKIEMDNQKKIDVEFH